MASFRVIVDSRFEADFRKVPFPVRRQINQRIFQLKDDPRPAGSEELSGPLHRLTVYGWKVVYDIDDDKRVVALLFIEKSPSPGLSP